MAIVDFASLSLAVQDYALRNDAAFVARLPDWVGFVEEDIQDRLKHRRMEQRATYIALVGSPYVVLPPDYLESRNFVLIDGTQRIELRSVSPVSLEIMFPTTNPGRPQAYAVIGNEARLMPVPDKSYTIEMMYFAMLPNLVTTANWLILNHPRVYLFGVLKDAFAWLKDGDAAQLYASLYEDAVSKLVNSAKLEAWSTSSLTPISDAPCW
jgi:hypothetical protein